MNKKHIHLNDSSPYISNDGCSISYLELFEECRDSVRELRDLVVRRCGKCSHDTLQHARHLYSGGGERPFIITGKRYYCLSCGVLWEVCNEVKDKSVE